MKTFKDYLQEISLKTKVSAYKKMKQTARETEDDHYEDPYYGPHSHEVKLANKRAGNMAKSIRKSHPKGGDVVKGINKKSASGGYDRDRNDKEDYLKNRERVSKQGLKKGDFVRGGSERSLTKDVAPGTTMKSGPRKGKLHPDLQAITKQSLKSAPSNDDFAKWKRLKSK